MKTYVNICVNKGKINQKYLIIHYAKFNIHLHWNVFLDFKDIVMKLQAPYQLKIFSITTEASIIWCIGIADTSVLGWQFIS